MFNTPYLLLGISTLIALIPIAIWLFIIFSKENENKKIVALVFLLGCLTAPALLLLQVLWSEFPRFNLSAFIETQIRSQTWMFIAIFILFGALEEIIKMYVLTVVDKKTTLIKTVNDTIRFSLASALGFAFTENIYYLYQFWPIIGTGQLVGMYIFRSIFTTCAHMIFSGIFGYYYAMGKFSIVLTKEKMLTEKVKKSTKILANIFNIPLSKAYQQKLVLKGLFLAVVIHALYNFILQMGYKAPVVLFIIGGAIYIWYLMKTKSGNLIINKDISDKSGKKLGKRDEEVIIDLITMWFKEKRYVDVIHVCQRLLERDPNNEVVKLFKARSMDYLEDSNPYKLILNSILKTDKSEEIQKKNILTRYLEEKEYRRKTREMIEKQLEKEGKLVTTEESKQSFLSKNEEEIKQTPSPEEYLEEFTKGQSFKIKD